MSLATTEERAHGWRINVAASSAFRFRPEQGDGVVGSIVFEHERERAAPVAKAKVLYAADIGVLRANCRVVVGLGESNEFVIALGSRVYRQVARK